MGLEFPMAEDLSLGGLTWDPAQPAKLRRADGTFYEPDTEFQATGSVDYLAPNGERGSFAYREQRGPDGKVTREYREAGLTRIQVCTLLRAAYVLAVIHRVTGDSECAVRSGVILAAFAKAVPGWPNFGAADETVPYQRPLAPDAYGD
jgi:hypothetical protein